jgi:hypothetical protein
MRLKNFLSLTGILSIFICSVYSQDSVAVKYGNTITAADMSEYLHVLASDSLEGREAGEPGQKKAARYLASKFSEFGLTPVVPSASGNSWFQHFNLIRKEWDEVYLKVDKDKKEFLKDFYVYGDLEYPEEEKLKPVFVGYGIDSKNYSDYKDLNVKGKAVIILMGEPYKDGISRVTGKKQSSEWANDWRKKAGAAKSKGARAVFIVVGNRYEEFENRLNLLKSHLAAPTLGFEYKQRPGSAIFVPAKLAAQMLKVQEDQFFNFRNQLSEKVPSDLKIKSSKVAVKVSVKKSVFETENVLGFLEGTTKKEEVIVITAHYDHLGIEGGKIHYGADDDGSGTSAVIELAQAFTQARKEGHGPERSILFMPVTAEEKGLLGSEYYTDKPVIPLNRTVADLNIDMIGRIDSAHAGNPDYVYLIGSDRLSTTLHKVSEDAAKKYVPEIKLDYTFNEKDDPNRFYYRSDHYNFAKNNIPVIFYFNGVHEDYHKPTDTVDKINFDKAAKTTRLIFYTAWELANLDKSIVVDVKEE